MFKNKTIILGVTGSIAAYRAASLCSKLVQHGANVHVVMTESAKKFITPLTFQALSQNVVMDDTFVESDPSKIAHIHYADIADLVLIAPATANTINKIRYGLADNMLTNLVLAVSNFSKIVIAPAMNVNMLNNPSTKESLFVLEKQLNIIHPDSGRLACGYDAEGKFPEIHKVIEKCERLLLRNSKLT